MNDSSNFKFQIGDVVSLGRPSIIEKVEEKNQIKTEAQFFSPLMVVIEAVLSKKEFDTITGSQKGGERVLCQWYDPLSGIFQKHWFLASVLYKVDMRLPSNPFLNTNDFLEKIKVDKLILFKSYCNHDLPYYYAVSENGDWKVQFERYKAFPVLAPIEISVAAKNDTAPRFNPKTGNNTRLTTQYDQRVKCIWYNPMTGKYAEDFFILESLTYKDAIERKSSQENSTKEK